MRQSIATQECKQEQLKNAD